MTEFDRILDDAFSRLEAGEHIGAILRRYPQHADALEPLLETAAFSLHAYTYFEPASPSGITRGRQRFLSEAATRAEKHRTRRSDAWLSWLWAPGRWAVTVGVLAVLLLAAGTTAVVALADSLPGDLLYPVKIAAEGAQLAVNRAPEARTQLHMLRAERRGQELETLVRRRNAVRADLVTASLSEAEAALRELSLVPAYERFRLLDSYTEFASAQAQRFARLSEQTAPSQQPVLDQASNRYRQLARLAEEGQTQPDAVTPVPIEVPPSRRTVTPTPTLLRSTATPTRRIRPAATATRPAPRPTATASRRVRPQQPAPAAPSTRPPRPQRPAIAVTRPVTVQPSPLTTNVRPTRTARPAVRPATRTPLRTRVLKPTRTPTARPGNVATAISTRVSGPPTRTPVPSATPNTGAVRPPTATPTTSPRPTREPTRPPAATPTPAKNKRTATPAPEKEPTATSPPNAVVTAQATATQPSTQPATSTPAIASGP